MAFKGIIVICFALGFNVLFVELFTSQFVRFFVVVLLLFSTYVDSEDSLVMGFILGSRILHVNTNRFETITGYFQMNAN